MEKLYVFMEDGYAEWEDMILFTSEAEAAEFSKIRPTGRVEIFMKSLKGYTPSYAYIRNGVYYIGTEIN
jgi:hypothetical protein